MAQRKKTVTVSFFTLYVSSADGSHYRDKAASSATKKSNESLPVKAVDWQQRLKVISESDSDSPGIRTFEREDRTVDGQTKVVSGRLTLSLSIDRPIPPRERNLSTGERKGMKGSGKEWDPAEETMVTFYERNIFGILSSNQGAPTHVDVAKWLTKFSPPYGNAAAEWKARPITRPEIFQLLLKERELTLTAAEFTVRPGNMDKRELSMFGLLSTPLNQNRGLEMKIRFSAGRSRHKTDNAKDIYDWLDDLIQKPMFQDDNKIKRGTVDARQEGGESRTYDLFSDHVTERLTLLWNEKDNEDNFSEAAVKTIDTAFHSLKDVLLRCVPEVPSAENR